MFECFGYFLPLETSLVPHLQKQLVILRESKSSSSSSSSIVDSKLRLHRSYRILYDIRVVK